VAATRSICGHFLPDILSKVRKIIIIINIINIKTFNKQSKASITNLKSVNFPIELVDLRTSNCTANDIEQARSEQQTHKKDNSSRHSLESQSNNCLAILKEATPAHIRND